MLTTKIRITYPYKNLQVLLRTAKKIQELQPIHHLKNWQKYLGILRFSQPPKVKIYENKGR
jgi:hypothetical protein